MANPLPSARATQAREALVEAADVLDWDVLHDAIDLIPEGSIILTAEEADQVRHELLAHRACLGSHLDYDAQPRRLNRQTLAVLAGGRNPA